MKNIWRKYKKLIVGGMAAVMVAAILLGQVATSVTEAEAASLLNSMDVYLNNSSNLPNNTFTILEIVPDASNVEYQEMGAFVKNSENAQDRPWYGVGTNYFNRSQNFFRTALATDSEVSKKQNLDALLEMRLLGLVKKAGVSIGSNDSATTEYPVYATWNNDSQPVFTEEAPPNDWGQEIPMYKYVFAYGNYVENQTNTGKYKLAEGYIIGDDGYIYYRGTDSISSNTISNAVLPGSTDNNDIDDSDDSDNNDNQDKTVSENTAEADLTNTSDDSTDDSKKTTDDSEKTADEQSEEADTSATKKSFEKTLHIDGATEEVTVDESTLESEEPTQNQDTDNDSEQADDASFPIVAPTYYPSQTVSVSINDIKVEPDWSLKYYRKGGDEPPYKPLPQGVIYCGETGDGNLDFVQNDKGLYWGYTTTRTFYATNGNIVYNNAEWFKTHVFGNRKSNINIKIVQKSIGEVAASDIADANLVYISGTASEFSAAGQMSSAAFQALYNATVVGNNGVKKAILMDYAAYSGAQIAADSSTLDKLAVLLWQANQKGAVSGITNSATYFNGSGAITRIDELLLDNSLFLTLQAEMLTGVQGNFVTGNLYVYNHQRDLFKTPKCMVDAEDVFANGDFNSSYKESVYTEAFGSVSAHISNNNSMYPNYSVAEDMITPALILQYILSTDGSNSSFVKASINVLEIQPTAAFKFNEDNYESKQFMYCNSTAKKNRKEFIAAYINPDWVSSDTITGKEGNVSFTSMTIDEFICQNENINEKYDMIYIGSEHSSTMLDANGRNYNYTIKNAESWDVYEAKKVSATITDFKDTDMRGMVYYNIGDISAAKTADMGAYLDTETKDGEKLVRYSGRDLNTEKLNQLEAYLDSGHPIIVAKDLMSPDSKGTTYYINPTYYTEAPTGQVVDHGRIDSSSKMYELFAYALHKKYDANTGKYVIDGSNGTTASTDSRISTYKYNNFISEKEVEAGFISYEQINEYLNTPQLFLDIGAMPQPYSYELKTVDDKTVINPDTVVYLDKDEDGSYYLDYEFTISGISATNQQFDYNVKLFVDVNSDGKFSSDEECNDAVVTYAATGSEVERDEESGEYILEEGTDYCLRRVVPENFAGIIPWCLRAQLSSDSRIQTNETGYTCIKAPKKGVVKILQIIAAGGSNNLQNDVLSNTGFGPYLNELADYEIKVKTLTVAQFVSNYKTDGVDKGLSAMGYFDNYDFSDKYAGAGKGVDMLVLGFGDNYERMDDTNGAVRAVKAFIDSGRPVLLSHDFLMFYDRPQERLLRDVLGMDRYGTTLGLSQLSKGDGHSKYSWDDSAGDVGYTGKTAGQEAESTGRAVAYQPGSERRILLRATQGFTNTQIMRYRTGSYYSYTYLFRNYSNDYYMNNKYMVDQINAGQLTEYPYHIAKSFAVTKTHAQYYQLDMESDSDHDGSTDTTVWYTLSYDSAQSSRTSLTRSMYAATPGDGVNQYYIYNKGNVTYTGAGHNSINVEEEIKLFVNTLLAAYTAADEAPEVQFFETADSSSNELENIAIPYDSTVTKGQLENGNANPAVTDSSIQYNGIKGDYDYKFVDPNVETVLPADRTATYFKVTDANFKKGTKRISLDFYLEVPQQPGTLYEMSDGTKKRVECKLLDGAEHNVVPLQIKVYEADLTTPVANHKEIVDENGNTVKQSDIQSGKMYAFFLPLKYLRERGAMTIYIQAQTYVNNVSTSGVTTAEVNEHLGYGKLDVTKVDLLKLD